MKTHLLWLGFNISKIIYWHFYNTAASKSARKTDMTQLSLSKVRKNNIFVIIRHWKKSPPEDLDKIWISKCVIFKTNTRTIEQTTWTNNTFETAIYKAYLVKLIMNRKRVTLIYKSSLSFHDSKHTAILLNICWKLCHTDVHFNRKKKIKNQLEHFTNHQDWQWQILHAVESSVY